MANTKRILIVEDEKPLARALQLKIQATGAECLTAEHGQAALELLEKENVDLIVLDLVMPSMDGFSFLEELQKKGKTIPVIVASNLGQEQDIERAKTLGVKDYFIKANISLAEIVEKVSKYS